MLELQERTLEKKTIREAAQWMAADERATEQDLYYLMMFLQKNLQAPYAVLFYNPELRVGSPFNFEWLLVGPSQTVQTLSQAANTRLHTEQASTTVWPAFYVDNPHYQGK